MIHAGDDVGMWNEEDGFFYDVLRLPDGRAEPSRARPDARQQEFLSPHGIRSISRYRADTPHVPGR
jgi:hypothetical protein